MNVKNLVNPEEETESVNEKSKTKFSKVRSKYILKKIFEHLKINVMLDIIKCNKTLEKRIDINIDNYKEYQNKYSPIEIEIIPAPNKYGNFINISRDKKYFHIFFNESKKEINRTYLNPEDKDSKIKIIIDYQVDSLSALFMQCKCIQSINFKKFRRNNIKNMSWMFYNCSSLKELNLSNFNTENVTNMNYMFMDCKLLEKLDFTSFNIKNLKDKRDMFLGAPRDIKMDFIFKFNVRVDYSNYY